ncbi:MAG: siroheme synthase CysG [Pseudomonadota bacterium]
MRTATFSRRKPSNAAPTRMDPLSVLPVFLNLQNKRAVLIGGSEAAAWKAELLASAGARVDIYATTIDDEMADLLRNGASSGTLTHHKRPWGLDCLAPASCIIADAETDDEARALVCAARGAGVPINIIDKPAFCQFQFGSIVNRSPAVISISTAGAAPIMGQAIRRKIETLLPQGLKGWAAAAQAVRATVMERLSPGPERRAFWERFVDRAFSGERPPETASDDLYRSIHQPGKTSGRVTLVGAGPGDPELLTMKAIRALQAADVILFDDLVSDAILELARREAKRMMVGKRGGRDSCKQDDINALMIKLAGQGKHVVRLKSGDPMVFGRAGEEIDALRAHDIPVSIVPGITSASALASQAGVSLTHRDHAQAVSFVTGHSKKGALPTTLDLAAMAKPGTSHIIYMGGRTAPDLTSALLAHGGDGSRPVLVARSVSRPDEQIVCGQLKKLPELVAETHGDGPLLIGIGDAFGRANINAPLEGPAHNRADDFQTTAVAAAG